MVPAASSWTGSETCREIQVAVSPVTDTATLQKEAACSFKPSVTTTRQHGAITEKNKIYKDTKSDGVRYWRRRWIMMIILWCSAVTVIVTNCDIIFYENLSIPMNLYCHHICTYIVIPAPLYTELLIKLSPHTKYFFTTYNPLYKRLLQALFARLSVCLYSPNSTHFL